MREKLCGKPIYSDAFPHCIFAKLSHLINYDVYDPNDEPCHAELCAGCFERCRHREFSVRYEFSDFGRVYDLGPETADDYWWWRNWTNNPATLNFAEAILKEAGIDYFVLDQNMSVLEPGIMIPRRLMVVDEDEAGARRQLTLAGLEKDLMESS